MCGSRKITGIFVLLLLLLFSAPGFSQGIASTIETIAKLSFQLDLQLQACKKALTKAWSEIELLQKQLSETSESDKQRYEELSKQLETQKAEYETQATELTRLSKLTEQLEQSRVQAEIERDTWRVVAIVGVSAAIIEFLIIIFHK